MAQVERTGQKRAWRRIVTALVCLSLVIVAFLLSLRFGSVSLSLDEVLRGLFEQSESLERQIVWNLRLPRVLVGLMVGMALAMAGALLQGVMRNPLADPGIIGVSAGAACAAVVMMLVFPELVEWIPLAAFGGAFVAAVTIYALAYNRGVTPLRLILAGVAVNALLGSITSGFMTIFGERVQSVLPWLAGGLSGASWPQVEMIAPYFIVAVILSLFLAKQANVLLLGDEVAKLLGHHVERTRILLLLFSTLLAGIAVSVSGLIGFVGLVIPHIIRMMVGDDYRFLLPISGLAGAGLVALSDMVARTAFDPLELPVGILLSVLGAPFFLFLLNKEGRHG